MHLTIRQLQVFEATARLLSFRKAADELHLSQPAVSMQIKQLEENVGLPLFEKLGKQIYMTEAGREIYHYSRSIGQLLNEADEVINGLKGAYQGRLSIAVASTAKYFVPTLLGTFHKRFPGVTVTLDVTNRKALLEQLSQNLVDLVIMGQPPEGANLEAGTFTLKAGAFMLEAGAFMENPLVIVAPPTHALAKQTNIPLQRLEDEVFLTRERGSGTRDAIERFFTQHEVQISTGMEIASNEAIKQSVQAGLGLGLLSRDTLEMELALGKLVILDVEDFPIMRHWYVMHRKGKRLSTVTQAFKHFLLEEANKLLHNTHKD